MLPRNETAAWLRLVYNTGLPGRLVRAVVPRWSATGRPLAALFDATDEDLVCLDLRPLRLAALRHSEPVAEDLLDSLPTALIGLLPFTAPDYPTWIESAGTFCAPPLLTWRGTLDPLRRPNAAIIGSRDASDRALDYAHRLAGWLARAKVNVISGHARGIDQAAHAGAAERGGPTTAVLPEGLLRFTGGDGLNLVLSSYHPLAVVRARRALERNGLITALSRCVIVVESRTTGGTWNAAQQALAQKRPVLCRADRGTGNEALLRLGAVELPAGPLEASEVVMGHLTQTPPKAEEAPRLPGF